MKFPCTKCGACCRRFGKFAKDYDRGDGVCLFLTSENLCSVYKYRPLICNVMKLHKVLMPHLSEEEYVKMNIGACKVFIDEDKMGKEFYPEVKDD